MASLDHSSPSAAAAAISGSIEGSRSILNWNDNFRRVLAEREQAREQKLGDDDATLFSVASLDRTGSHVTPSSSTSGAGEVQARNQIDFVLG